MDICDLGVNQMGKMIQLINKKETEPESEWKTLTHAALCMGASCYFYAFVKNQARSKMVYITIRLCNASPAQRRPKGNVKEMQEVTFQVQLQTPR